MRILVTAGPTREPVDAVRFLSNRSSGKMGYAIAAAGLDRGHDVVLVSGPVALTAPPGLRVVNVQTALDMDRAVRRWVGGCDVLVMAAAVADWRPKRVHAGKLKKSKMPSRLILEKTPDILKGLGRTKGHRIHVGFAAETGQLLKEARRKLVEKRLDLIVANDVSKADSGFDVDTNRATFLADDGSIESVPLMSKRALAHRIVQWIEHRAGWSGGEKKARKAAATKRLDRQIDFIREIDKLKHIYRQTRLMNDSRNENDAEHSWHLAVMAVLLSEYAEPGGFDMTKVLKMLLIHDLVEIDAGDTFCYDDKRAKDKVARETKAARRIFGLLPRDQARAVRALWNEFEARKTPEARYAAGLDRLQPLLHNYATRGAAWKKHGVTRDRVVDRNRHIAAGSPRLWAYAEDLIRRAVDKGYLPV